MDYSSILITMIVICLGMILLMVLARPLKLLLRFFLNAVIGAGALSALHYMGLSVGANFLTTGLVGLLGLPGFIGVIIINIIL